MPPASSPGATASSGSFNPHSLYSNSASASGSSNGSSSAKPNTSQPSGASANQSGSAENGNRNNKKQTKRRKVNLACIYCRRSHMTCDEGRPCQRCIKRDIGHLCHDESTSRGSAPSSTKKTVSPKKSPSAEPQLNPLSAETSQTTPSSQLPSTNNTNLNGPNAMLSASSDSSASLPFFGANLGLSSAVGANTLRAGNSSSPFISGGSGPYSSASPMANLNSDNSLAGFNSSGAPIFRNSVSPLKTPGQGFSNLGLGSTSQAGVNPNGQVQANSGAPGFDWGLGSSNTGLGGAGWLGLGGGPGGYEGGGSGFSGDSAGGNEFTLLSEFLESLDGSGFGSGGATNNQQKASVPGGAGSRRNTISAQSGVTGNESTNGRASLPPPDSNYSPPTNDTAKPATGNGRGTKRPRTSSVSAVKTEEGKGAVPYSAALRGASKTERFFLTAADQKDGPRDERLSKVIQAKYEAGLLRPYNHVNGYARLNRWMERNVSQASKRRILKPLSVFRPAFRAVAQSLTNIDLIFIEEAFERMLLDYDRVFSTQGIPACLWRRTGEIYKGNKEFAELVGVPIESLREGRLCIYELMAEESAVNYWEKYGAVSFDPGQKAVLTSCVLRTKNKAMIAGGKDRLSSAKIIAAQLPHSHAGSSGQTTPISSKNGFISKTEAQQQQQQPSSGGNAQQGQGQQQQQQGAATTATSASTSTIPKVSFIHCCFSFTIRRDQWNIPTMIVGNFLPTNPP